MPPLPTRQRRREFRKVADREARILQSGRGGPVGNLSFSITADFDQVIKDVEADVNFMTDNIVLRVSKLIANEFRAGRSRWRVRTGYSRSRFVGHKDGVHNSASYAPILERRYRDGREYVDNRLAGAVRHILTMRSRSVRRRLAR